jgi:peroxiredoxin
MQALVCLGLLSLSAVTHIAPEDTASRVGKTVEPFTLRDYRGAERSLAEFSDKKVVVIVFVGCECPLAKLYGLRLTELAKSYESKSVAFIGVNSNQQDSATEIGEYAKNHGIPFPILKDVGNAIADRLGAVRTPEAFVLDAKRVIRYHGRIDDQYGIGFARPKAEHKELVAAIDELLAGKPVSVASAEAPGCYIGRVQKSGKSGSVTYARDVAPILQKRCVECHRAGQIAPFALTTYDEVVGWTATMREVVEEGRMPPWHADPNYGKFSNDARLSPAEKQTLIAWINDGAPAGELKDAPKQTTFTDEWRIPKPDKIVTIPKPFKVPAQGDVPYQFIVVDSGFTEDKWVKAVEVKPSCRSVVHHILVFTQPPGTGIDENGGFIANWIAAMAPGSPPQVYPPGSAKRVPAGSRFIFQIHYTPDGVERMDQSCFGMVFADPSTVKHEVKTQMAANERFAIPPHDGNHKVEAKYTFRNDSILLEMLPHTHLRGKAFRYEALYPNGDREILLDVPKYDFNWQNAYMLAEPKKMPKGTKIHCTAYFDNSKNNRSNPDPDATVRWGDQTWEEMMIGYFSAMPVEERAQTPAAKQTTPVEKPPLAPVLQQSAQTALSSDDAFAKFANEVHKALPQVDRVCLTTINGGSLKVEHASYPGNVERKMALAGFTSQSKAFALAFFSLVYRVTAVPDLSKAFGSDLKQFSASLGSSVHIPVAIDGMPGTLNFWSKGKDAFPKDLHPQLSAIAEAMVNRPRTEG